MKLAIEIVVLKTQQAGAALAELGKKVGEVGAALRDGFQDGADRAAKELARPRAELEKLGLAASDTLKLRPHIEIDGDIAKVKQAYVDLKNSGTASITELAQAKLKMKERIIELRAETSGWAEAMGKAKTAVAGLVTAGAGLGVAGKAAIDFESAMAEVRKTTDATPAQLDRLGASIKHMSATMPVAQAELARIAALGGQLGIPMQSLDGFIQVTAKTSVAFGMTAEQTADAIGKLANVFGLPISGVTGLNNAVNVLGNSMAASERDILSVLTRTGGIARQFGLSAKATAALASSMLSLGDTPEVAGTAINNLLTKLQSANVQGAGFKKALESIGLSAGKLAADIQANPQQALDDFLGAIEQLSAQEKTETLGKLFGAGYDTASIAKLTGNLKLYQEALGRASGDTDGALDKEFQARLETTQAALDMAGNSFRNLAIAVGEVFAPAIEKVAELVGRAAQGIAQFAENHPTMTGVIAAFATLAASATALSVAWSALVLGGAKLIASVGDILSAIKPLAAFLLANPIIAAILGVAAAGAAVYVYWDDIAAAARKAMSAVAAAFKGAGKTIRDTVRDWARLGGDLIDGLIAGIKARLTKLMDGAGKLAKGVLAELRDAFDIHSPSRETWKIGEDVADGLIGGLLARAAERDAEIRTLARDIAGGIRAGAAEVVVVEPAGMRRDRLGRIIASQDIEDLDRTQARYGSGAAAASRYLSAAGRLADNLRNTWERAFKGMEDALVKFVETGKLNFRSLADGIIRDLARIQIQEGITKPLARVLSGVNLGSLFGFAQGGAPGGVSAWRNQIVNRPTFFAFARGGVMGEAGPEAIMPLRRDGSGRLGVDASGGNVQINVQVTNNVAEAAQVRVRQHQGPQGAQIELSIDRIEAGVARNVAAGRGPLTAVLQRRFGLNPAAGAV